MWLGLLDSSFPIWEQKEARIHLLVIGSLKLSQEQSHMQFTDRIFQDISENFSTLCYTNDLFLCLKSIYSLNYSMLSKLLNKVLTFFSERKGLKIILKEHHFHSG